MSDETARELVRQALKGLARDIKFGMFTSEDDLLGWLEKVVTDEDWLDGFLRSIAR
jgi:hypothetical protein